MNKEKFTWGLILLIVGAIILLSNLGYVDFYWRSVFNMWPVILIVVGVNMLLPRRGVGNVISILVTVVALVFLAYWGTMPPKNNWWTFRKQDRVGRVDSNTVGGRARLSEERFAFDYKDSISEANLTIRGGAIEYEIDGTTDKLFEANTKSTVGNHTVDLVESGDSTLRKASINFLLESNDRKGIHLGHHENSAEIRLNTSPVWNISLDFGAGAADFDLAPFKIGELRIKGGASAVEIKLGNPLASSEIHVDAGVASVEIEIPESAACRVVTKSGLSSRSFPGFSKQDDGSYLTPGYEHASTKYTIYLVGGLSAFEVKRY